MGTVADKLEKLSQTKEAIRQAIIGKGQKVSPETPFSGYPEKIAAIQAGGWSPRGTVAELDYDEPAVTRLESHIGTKLGELTNNGREMSKLSVYKPGRGQKPLTPDDNTDAELVCYVSDTDTELVDKQTKKRLVRRVDLVAAPDEYGLRSAIITINGVEGSYVGRTVSSAERDGITVPVTFDHGTTGKQGLLHVTVTPADTTAPAQKYTIMIQLVSSRSDIDYITYTNDNLDAELQYGADGAPLTLALADAQARYDSMPHSQPMSEKEKSFYFDADGKAIRRVVYRGWLSAKWSTANAADPSISAVEGVALEKDVLMINLKGKDTASEAQLIRYDSDTPVKGKGGSRYNVRYDQYITSSERSLIQPLVDAKGAAEWDQVYIRIYGQVVAEDGTTTYAVLELGLARTGNYKIARVETDAAGDMVKDASGEVKLIPADTETVRTDPFGIWVCETGVDYHDHNPNGKPVNELNDIGDLKLWTKVPNDSDIEDEGQGGDYDPAAKYFEIDGMPTTFKAVISADATEVCVTVKTEDPYSCVGIAKPVDLSDGKQAFVFYSNDYQTGAVSKVIQLEPGQSGIVYIHVRSQNLSGNSDCRYDSTSGKPLYGRLYELRLEREGAESGEAEAT